jgi:hypothetical protein
VRGWLASTCILCGQRDGVQEHHRRLRSQGGHRGPTIPLCLQCHVPVVHANVDWANRHGLILRTGDDPAVLVTSCGTDCTEDHR